MVYAYIVRCNFTAPAKEPAWNAWYSGPKIVQMLAQPHFLTCQRFRRAAGAGRDYLALWTLDSPEGMRTPQYTAQWGFREWQQDVADWSRDLFDGGPATAASLAVPLAGALQVVSFDGMAAEAAQAARARLAPALPGTIWLTICGLDRHTPLIGLRPLAEFAAPPDLAGDLACQAAVYRPLIAQQT
jgi:hypothetical protein